MYKTTLLEKVIIYVILLVVGVAMLVSISLIEYFFMQDMESIFLFHFIKTSMFSLMFACLFGFKKQIERAIRDRKLKKKKADENNN